jgi:hypothetical protein
LTPKGRVTAAEKLMLREIWKFGAVFAVWVSVFALPLAAADKPSTSDSSPDGNATIRAQAGSSEIVITTTARLAGAVHSLQWGGREFIDSHDHGRQLQSACSFGNGPLKDFWAEAYNPTEAGSRADGAGPKSSSRLLSLQASGPELRTTTQMAFWLAPGENSSGHPARNTTVLSNHRISKRLHIGYKEWPQAIEYEVTFKVPEGQKHTFAQFEAVTGYMPPFFSRFWKFNPTTAELEPLDDGPGEQRHPVVLATPNGSHAMGVYSPDQPSKGFANAGYGRFRFKAEKVVKWNCVFRIRDPKEVPAGKQTFRMFVVVGNLDDVKSTLTGLTRAFRQPVKKK